jgi:ribosomal protein S18 acetylase RimI-like enzyme
MRSMSIRTIDQREQTRATNIQLMAFSSDPIMRWLWPEADAYVRSFAGLVRGFGGGAFEKETAHVTDDFHGGALWLPPGVGPDDESLGALFRDTVPEPQRSAVFSILEQMGASHPHEPHWHLAFIGVDPVWHGQGIGAALLAYALEKIDQQGLQAYLESSNPRNVPLYQRHGFEVIREIRVGGSPPVIPMLRSSRRSSSRPTVS